MKKRTTIASVIFIGFVLMSFPIIHHFFKEEKKQDERILTDHKINIEKRIISVFHDAYDAAKLVSFVNQQSGIENFEKIAKDVFHETDYFNVISIIQGDRIRYVYPLRENKKYIGYKVLDNKNRKYWLTKAIKDSTIFFEGPFLTHSGKAAINGRLPFYENGKYAGYCAVSIDWEYFTKKVGISNNPIFSYGAFAKNFEGKTNYFLSEKFNKAKEMTQFISFPNSNMKIWINYKQPKNYIFSYLPIYLFALFISFFVAYAVYFKLSENERIKYLVNKRTNELKESRSEFKQLFEYAADLINRTDLKGNFIDVNQSMCEFTGYKREELLMMNFSDLLDEDILLTDPYVLEVVKDGKSILKTTEIKTKNGETKTIEITISLINENEILGIGRDKTEIDHLYKRNNEINKMFKAGFENTSIGMAFTNADGSWFNVNNALSLITGYSKSELLDLSFQKLSHPDDLNESLSFVKMANEGNVNEFKTIKRYLHKNGHIIWVDIRVSVVRDERNIIQFFIAHIDDISEKIRLENELKEEKIFSDLIINSIPGILYVTNDEGEIVRVSNQVFDLFENKPVIGKKITEILDESEYEKVIEQRKEVFLHGKAENEYKFKQSNGSHKTFYIVNSLINNNGETGTLGIGIDITKLKEYERKLIDFQSDLTERNKELKCLFKASELGMDIHLNKVDLLSRIVKIIPQAFLYPKETYAKIIYKGNEYLSIGHQSSTYLLEEDILELGNVVGKIVISCTHTFQNQNKNPFLKEEKELLKGLAKIICTATEKRFTLKNLRKSEEKYRYLFENLPGAIMIWDLDKLELIEFNNIVPELYGYSREEMLGMSVKAYRPSEFHESIEKFAKVILTQKSYNQRNTWVHLKKSGEKMYMDITSLRIDFNGRNAILSVGTNITDLILAKEKQKELTTDVRRLKSNIETVRDEERLNLSRELHDDLGQKLTVMHLYLSMLEHGISHNDELYSTNVDKIQQFNQVITESISTVRNLSASLRSGLLGEAGLVIAINDQCKKIQELYRLNCELAVQDGLQNLKFKNTISKEIFRIFQESITNVIRHAGATSISINLSSEDDLFVMEIYDDGKGFNKETMRKNSLGLLGLKERAFLINADVNINSELNKGTCVTLMIQMNLLIEP